MVNRLYDTIQSIPDHATVWVQITEENHQGDGWVSQRYYGFWVDPKSLKKACGIPKVSLLERFKKWMKNL